MGLKIIGVKELRQNLATITRTAIKKDERYIVMKNSVPVLEIKPIVGGKKIDALLKSIKKAEAEIKTGKVYSAEEVEKEFGLI